jgi:hypothetical protein
MLCLRDILLLAAILSSGHLGFDQSYSCPLSDQLKREHQFLLIDGILRLIAPKNPSIESRERERVSNLTKLTSRTSQSSSPLLLSLSS